MNITRTASIVRIGIAVFMTTFGSIVSRAAQDAPDAPSTPPPPGNLLRRRQRSPTKPGRLSMRPRRPRRRSGMRPRKSPRHSTAASGTPPAAASPGWTTRRLMPAPMLPPGSANLPTKWARKSPNGRPMPRNSRPRPRPGSTKRLSIFAPPAKTSATPPPRLGTPPKPKSAALGTRCKKPSATPTPPAMMALLATTRHRRPAGPPWKIRGWFPRARRIRFVAWLKSCSLEIS